MAYPIATVVTPGALNGQRNGELDPSILVKPGFPGRPAGRVLYVMAPAWRALADEVLRRFGEVITVTSTNDAYRNLTIQTNTFRNRYTTTRLSGRPYKIWNGTVWYQKPGTAMSGVPGTSNHGKGLACDVCLWRNNQAVGITANMAMFNWLLLNAFRYGFSWEAQSEPWHLRYYVGDKLPPALAGTTPTPTPDPGPGPTPPTPGPTPNPAQEDSVFQGLMKRNNDVAIFASYSGGYKVWVADDGMWTGYNALLALGGKSTEVQTIDDPNVFAALGPILGPVPGGRDQWGNIP